MPLGAINSASAWRVLAMKCSLISSSLPVFADRIFYAKAFSVSSFS
jgi:hypothetical protein